MTTYIVVVPPSVRVGMPVIGVPAVRTIYTAILLGGGGDTGTTIVMSGSVSCFIYAPHLLHLGR